MPRGRTRDEGARLRVLDAAFELVGAASPGQVTINEIAERAGVAKQTIYRWWPSRTAVMLDALVRGTMEATPFRGTDDPRADFERHLKAVIRLFNSDTGSMIRELLAEGQADPEIAAEFRDRFWGPRRELSRSRLVSAVERGLVRDDLDVDLVLDAIYGPLWLGLLIGHRSLRAGDAARILDAVWAGIAVGPSA
ncbi:MAG: TetR/AcrR family transcriptional regulator [Actinomycetota bacterium]